MIRESFFTEVNELSIATKSSSSFISEKLTHATCMDKLIDDEIDALTSESTSIEEISNEKTKDVIDERFDFESPALESGKVAKHGVTISPDNCLLEKPQLATTKVAEMKSSSPGVAKEHALQIVVKGGFKGKVNDACESPVVSKTEMLRSETTTPISVEKHNLDEDDLEYDTSDSTCHKKYGLIRYRSLRDHNGRYFLVVKIR